MSQSRTLFIGRDVHQDSMAVASVAQDHGAAVLSWGPIGTRQCDIEPLIRTMPSQATHLGCVYEASPCGYWLSRYVTTKGDDCWGVAPSLMPKQAGDRVKTDRRAAVPLARLARSGDRTAGYVPTVADAAIRDLSRAREETLSDGPAATLRRHAFVRHHALRSPGRAPWHPAPRRWRAAVVGQTPGPHSVFQASVDAVTAHTARLQRLAQARQAHGTAWRLPPVGEALPALRGVPCPVAVPLVAARGDLRRFDPPRARMQGLGLMPAAYSTGARRRQGALTQAGHTQARRALGASAWAYR
jgi:transposase